MHHYVSPGWGAQTNSEFVYKSIFLRYFIIIQDHNELLNFFQAAEKFAHNLLFFSFVKIFHKALKKSI